MIIGKKDKQYVEELKLDRKLAEDHYAKGMAQDFISYMHNEYDISYSDIGKCLGFSQQHANNLALGNTAIKNEKFFDTIIKVLLKK